MVHTVKGFGIVNKAEIGVFLELSCFFDDPADVGNLISGSSAFSKASLNIWNFMVHVLLKSGLKFWASLYYHVRWVQLCGSLSILWHCLSLYMHTHIHIHQGILVTQKNKIMPFAATWMDLEIVLLTEVSQIKTNITYHLYVDSKTWHKWTYVWNGNRFTGIETRPVDVKEEGRLGMEVLGDCD